jgi:beta-fructofuranosidase
MSIFYRPSDSIAADFIPFYWQGKYHLFYLRDWRDPANHGEGTPWDHLVTQDFVHFEDWGEALPRGTKDEQDLYVFTGSVIEANDQFHIFYTGHNPYLRKAGRPEQGILHATSPDLHSWTKDPDFRFFAPSGQQPGGVAYEPHDWRDPFVFWDEQTGEYRMLLAARLATGQSRNRGCTALAASPDLRTWRVLEPFWTPDLYFTHECPDLFRIGDWWYLVYSTFTERCVTHYRMSRSLEGPWLAPADDAFDSRAYYAAKTASDVKLAEGSIPHRFLFGWLPTRVGEKDDGDWQWGGNLVVHKIHQRPDGTLAVRPPETVLAAFPQPVELSPSPVLGEWQVEAGQFSCDSTSRHSILGLGTLPDEALLEGEIDFTPGTAAFGLLLRADPGMDSYYQFRFEPANHRVVVDRWPRPGDQPFMLERPLKMQPGQPVRLQVIVSDTCLVAYLDGETALSCRMYDHPQGSLGLFVTEGMCRFTFIKTTQSFL